MKKYERDQLRKRHGFLHNLPSPDPKQQKRFAEEATQQRQQLKEAYGKTLQLYSDVYLGVDELRQKTVTEILVRYGIASSRASTSRSYSASRPPKPPNLGKPARPTST